jgi:hypothetical protein
MSGWSVIHSGWIVFTAGKAATLIGDPMLSAMIVIEETDTGMCSQGETAREIIIESFGLHPMAKEGRVS